MGSLSRNIFLDLLPVYIAGEASRETRALVEEFALGDPEIAALIRTGTLDPGVMPPKGDMPDTLEMKTMKRIRGSIRRQMWYVALTTASILMVPLLAMVFTDEVDWTLFDFVVMGSLLLGTGFSFVLISRNLDNVAYRAGVGTAAVTGFLLVWVTLAVGIIGSENHPANLLYGGVLAIGAAGAATSRFRPRGMSYTMFVTATAQLLVPVVAWIVWRPTLDDPPGMGGVFMLNAVFALLFTASGLMFRRVARKHGNP